MCVQYKYILSSRNVVPKETKFCENNQTIYCISISIQGTLLPYFQTFSEYNLHYNPSSIYWQMCVIKCSSISYIIMIARPEDDLYVLFLSVTHHNRSNIHATYIMYQIIQLIFMLLYFVEKYQMITMSSIILSGTYVIRLYPVCFKLCCLQYK